MSQAMSRSIMDYYDNFNLRFTSGTITCELHRLEKGVITRCILSVTLFSLAMNMLVKLAKVECRGLITKSGVQQPPIRAFMDDLTVTTASVPGSRWILQGLERLSPSKVVGIVKKPEQHHPLPQQKQANTPHEQY